MSNNVGLNIKKYRKEKGLTQEELANKIGKSTITIRKYESGDILPSIYNVAKIALVLGISNTDIIGEVEEYTGSDINREDKKEMINYPSHYNQGKFEAIDVFKSITGEMTRLFEIKNKNYGNSFSKQFDEYGLTSVCIRLEDKLNRLKSLNKQISEAKNGIVDINVDDESIRDTLIDLANYSVLAIMEISKGE